MNEHFLFPMAEQNSHSCLFVDDSDMIKDSDKFFQNGWRKRKHGPSYQHFSSPPMAAVKFSFWVARRQGVFRAQQKRLTTQGLEKEFTATKIGKNIFIPIEDEEERVIDFPFSEEDMLLIWSEYSAKSPFFSALLDRLLEQVGLARVTEGFNFFEKPYYKKGTLSYWTNFYFGRRKVRDQLSNFLEKWCVRPILVAQGDEVLEASGTTGGEANMTFVDERPIDNDSTHLTGEVQTRDKNMDMAETPWNLNQILTREVVLARTNWSSQGAGADILTLPFPKCFTDVKNSIIKSQLQLFGFARFGVRFRIQLNGTKFHCGRIIAAIFPLMWADDRDYYPIGNWTCLPHGFLDASVSNSVTLEVPFTHLLSHFPLRAGSLESDSLCSLGRLRLAVFNELRVGEGASSSLALTVFGQIVNPEMHQPVWPIEKFSFSNGLVTQGEEGFMKGILSRGFSTVLGNFLTTMTGGLATGVSKVLAGLIFDKPIDPLPAAPVVNRSVNAPCHGAGLDNSVRLALCPISQTETTENVLGGTAADFSLNSLCSVPSLLETVVWAGANESGHVLTHIPVCPTYLPNSKVRIEDSSVVVYEPTMLSYVSRAFVMWRGDLVIKMQVIGTAFHSGRIAVIYDPSWTPFSNTPLDLENLMNMNTLVIDVQEQQEIAIKIPFHSVKPWLRCDALRSYGNYQPADRDWAQYLGMSTGGRLSFVVLNTLVAPSNVSADIDVNFFIYAGDNFELAVPTSLDPLSLVPPGGAGQYGELQEYPFIIPALPGRDIFFENKEMITALYFQCKHLLASGKIIQDNPGDNWWNFSPLPGWGDDTETITWAYRAHILELYVIGTPQRRLMENMPKLIDPPSLVVQGLEEYTTTRSNEVPEVCVTKGSRFTEIAPSTISENAMNLQTVLRRYYPLMCSVPVYSASTFTLVCVPVSPTLVPKQNTGVGNFVEPNPTTNISWFTRLYTYFRGSLRFKFVSSDTRAEIYCWHIPFDCREFQILPGMKESDVQKNMCFAGNMSVTHLQAALEVEVPFFSTYNQLLIDVHGKYKDLRSQNGTLYFAIRSPMSDQPLSPISFSLFISTGEDYILNVIRPPPQIFEPLKRFSNCAGSNTRIVQRPEIERNLGDRSSKVAIPGTTGFPHIDDKGAMFVCDLQTQGLEALDVFHLGKTKAAVDNLLDRSSQLLNNIESSNVVQNISALTGRLDSAVGSIEESARTVPERVMGATSQTLTRYAVLTAEVVACGAVLFCIHNCLKDPSIANFISLTIATAGAVGLAISNTIHDLIHSVVNWVFNMKPEFVQTQALDGTTHDFLDSNSGIIAAVVAVLGTVFYAFAFNVVPSFSKIKASIKSFFEDEEPPAKITQGLEEVLGLNLRNAHFSVLGITALDKVFTKITDLVTRFLNWILDRENPAVIIARTTSAYQDRVLNLIKEIDELEYEPVFIEALSTPLIHNRFYRMMDEVHALTRIAVEEKLDPRVVSLITESRKRAQTLIQNYERDTGVPTKKYDPYVVCLHGPTGTGKTHIMHRIGEVIAEEMNLPEYNRYYCKALDDKFWSGYKGQPIVKWDEFGQDKEADKKVSQFMVLRGTTPVLLNMSESKEKGRPFTSQAIIMTTNVPYQDYNTIRCNEAFKRRRLLMIQMNHKEGFDVNRLQNAAYNEFPNYEHVTFAETFNERRQILRDNMSWPDVEQLLRQRVRAWHANRMAELTDSAPKSLPRGIVAYEVPTDPNFREGLEGENIEEQIAEALRDQGELDDEIREIMLEDAARQHLTDEEHEVWSDTSEELGETEGSRVASPILSEPESENGRVIRNYLATTPEVSEVELSEGERARGEALVTLMTQGCEDVYEEPSAKISRVVLFKKAEGLELTEEEELECDLFLMSSHSISQKARTKFLIAKKSLKNAGRKMYNIAEKCFKSLSTIVQNFYNDHPKIAKCLGLLTLMTGVAIAMYTLRGEEKSEEGAYESGPSVQRSTRVKMAEAGGPYEPSSGRSSTVRVKSQGTEDAQAIDIKRKIHPYIHDIEWLPNQTRGLKMKCFQIGGSCILLPYHFFSGAVEGERFSLLHRYHPMEVEFVKSRMHRLREYDWVVYDCGPRLEPGRRMLKHFVKEQDLGKIDRSKAFLLGVDRKTGVMVEALGRIEAVKKFEYTDPKFGDTYVQKGWRTNFATMAGDCGSVLLVSNVRAEPPGKIVGIHVAGRDGYNEGYCVLITRETVEEAYALVSNVQVGEAPIIQAMDRTKNVRVDCRITPQGDYTLYGVMPNRLCPIQPIKTSFQRTPFHDAVSQQEPSPKIPAHLRPFENEEGQRISPLKIALEKYGRHTIPFPQRNLDKIEFYLTEMFKDMLTEHTGKRVWTSQEAVVGLPGVKFADRLNMKSSPGWPYQIIERNMPGKYYLFDDEGNIVNELLNRCVTERIESAQELERVPSLWRDCMKDELRPTEKVNQGKTRLFNIAPVDFTIVTRMYLMDFVMAFYSKNCDKFFSAVGMNPESYEWTKMYDYLSEVGKRAIGGDFECFDGKAQPELFMLISRVINAWYNGTSEENNVRSTLFMEMIHTMQLCENCVYSSHQGNPSGNPLTVIINTIINLIYMLLAWQEIYPEKSIEDFFQECRIIAYGDDNVITVSPKAEKFTQNAITETLAQYKIVYTAETKDGRTFEYRDLDEITFLKRGFRRDPAFGSSFVLPTMAVETLNSYLYYYREADDVENQLRENMRAGLSFAVYHGRDFYNAYYQRWAEQMRSVGYRPLTISFEEWVDNFLAVAGAGGVRLNPELVKRLESALIAVGTKEVTEGMETFMKVSNNTGSRIVSGIVQAPFYYFCAALGLGSYKPLLRDVDRTDDRWAIAIPSGEGKSYLASRYPHVFLDHDELLLKAFSSKSLVQNLSEGLPWSSEEARKYDFPKSDRRILLVHHPDNTNRQIVGSFVTRYPTFIRTNIFQRLNLYKPIVKSRTERNAILLHFARKAEPELFREAPSQLTNATVNQLGLTT